MKRFQLHWTKVIATVFFVANRSTITTLAWLSQSTFGEKETTATHTPRFFHLLTAISASNSSDSTMRKEADKDKEQEQDDPIVDRSTLTLLEHINLNIPNHDHIDFYFQLLGCGMDPRKANNLLPDAPKKTLWANCGSSQFHLPFGSVGQRIPGMIGLVFSDTTFHGLKERLDEYSDSYATKEELSDGDAIRLTDHYGNVFLCRSKASMVPSKIQPQPIISPNDTEDWGERITSRYGRHQSECKGIDFVEFQCPVGTADKIATFYDSVFDATTTVVAPQQEEEGNTRIAIIAIGDVRSSGRASQSLLFRESTDPLPTYDGHHIAMYVGESMADFEQAFKNTKIANLVWQNPRFSDQVDTLEGARMEQQFRFKDIIDIETGEKIMELEHEMRCIGHPSWPGETTSTRTQ